jgi:hypothetical protein
MGFHYAANGAKVGHIYRNMYRQVSNRMQINFKQSNSTEFINTGLKRKLRL